MKCKNCKQPCEHVTSGLPGGWEYWYCTNDDCPIGSTNKVPQHPEKRNLNTLERRLDASLRVTPVSPLNRRPHKSGRGFFQQSKKDQSKI